MLLNLIALFLGLALLVWSSDKFVLGASATARIMGVSPLVIGLTIVGFGTSAPELLISAISAYNGNPALAIGNAIGSNIANIALILGASAMLAPLVVSSRIFRIEIPVLLAVMLFTMFLLIDGSLSRFDGYLLLLGMALVMGWIIYDGLTNKEAQLASDFNDDIPDNMTMSSALLWLFLGLTILVISSRLMVWGAVNIAVSMGISDLIIGLSIVAIGTSLPELGASLAAVKKKEFDIALGNVLGSNLFNSLGVLGLAGAIEPSEVNEWVLWRDMPLQIFLLLVVFMVAGKWTFGQGRISRTTGLFFLICFASYQGLLFYQSFIG